MEPQASPMLRTAVPKLHLLHSGLAQDNASDRPLFPKIDSARAPTSSSLFVPPCSRGNDPFASQPPLSGLDRVSTQRLYSASISYLDSSSVAGSPRTTHAHHKPRPPPPSTSTSSRSRSNNAATESNEFLILHPSLDLSDANGELSQLLLSKWSLDSGEHKFASISLFCEMKLSEVKRMTSWVETPNRFAVTAYCQLLNKYVTRLESQQPQRSSPESGASAAFLRKIHDELVAAIFAGSCGKDYASCVPYFLELKKLNRHAQQLMANVVNREQAAKAKAKLPLRLDKLLATHRTQANQSLLTILFRAWRVTATQAATTRTLKCRAFRASRKLNVSALFRAWRIEALRRAYQRESVEYQTMLSITAASLSRKDVQITEADAKMASMAKIIDSLTESNAQLLYRVEQLEATASGKGGGAGSTSGHGGFHRSRHDDQIDAYDRIDSLTSSNGDDKANGSSTSTSKNATDEKTDRTNRMLLETLVGMARMVESCAIQLSKDVMDSLEHQFDGTMLQQLAEMVHADNIVKIKAEEARGLGVGVVKPSTPTPVLSRKISTNVAFTNSTMLASLGKGAVAVKDLAAMPVDAFLLNWFKMHLQASSAAEKTSDRTIKNFTSDLADGRRFSFLLHRLFPTWFDANMVHEIDADERLKNVAGFHARVQPTLPLVVTSDSIHSGSATENIAFTAMLFGLSVNSIRRLNLDRQREKFLNIITSWKRVRSLLLEVKRMHDSYDALMVAHLLKEMRTCETLFKQLNSELSAMAIASNESAAALSQIAYKVLTLTWRCLHASATPGGIRSLELVDERLAERVKDFAHVDLATVRQLLLQDSQHETPHKGTGAKALTMALAVTPQAVAEKEVVARTEAVRTALVVYCKDLHDIFKHYSASGSVGSIASMSLSEFLKLVRDCGLITSPGETPTPTTGHGSAKHAPVATSITQAMVEFIFRASLFFSPLTPREFLASTLSHTVSQPPQETSQSPVETFVLPTADPLRPDAVVAALDFGDREMAGGEFVDALLRLAAIKCLGNNKPPLPLLETRFRDLMEIYILPNALRSQSEIFRAEVASPKVRAVFQKHKPVLQCVFKYYTSMHTLREQQSTMDWKEFLLFARDCKLVGSFVTEHMLKQVLVSLQREASTGTTSPGAGLDDATMLRVDFADFQEALAALTAYVICNPYVPLYKRIEQFLHEHVLPKARQKKKAAGE